MTGWGRGRGRRRIREEGSSCGGLRGHIFLILGRLSAFLFILSGGVFLCLGEQNLHKPEKKKIKRERGSGKRL